MSLWRWLKGLVSRTDEPTLARPGGAPASAVPEAHVSRAGADLGLVTDNAEPRRREESASALQGPLLQFPRASSSVTDVIVGFDFGTSSVKAALRVPYMLSGVTTIVDFGRLGHPSNPFLLPAVIHRGSDGSFRLDRPEQSVESRRHLKLPLIAPEFQQRLAADDGDDLLWAVAFVALALREVRGRFLATQGPTYGSPAIKWSLNLGIPSAGYDDDATRERFRRLGAAAWALSLRWDRPTAEAAREAWESSSAADPQVPVAVIPEVAAEVVAYAKSRQRRDGLHLILDVGASTLDLAAVSFHRRDGEDAFSFLTADVAPLGLLDLHRRRMEAAGRQPPFDAVPADLVAALPSGDSAPDDAIRACDRAYADACATRMLQTLVAIRRRRDPNSPTWLDRMPLFILGGGADAVTVDRFVRDVEARGRRLFAAPERRAQKPRDWQGFRREAAMVDQLRSTGAAPSEAQKRRLVVACGLAYPEVDLGPIDSPSVVSDVEERRYRDRTALFISKSDV